jgi:hypothetical protein
VCRLAAASQAQSRGFCAPGAQPALAHAQSSWQGLKRMASVKRGHVLVIGSEDPWLEACALEAGATRVTTLEYGAIRSLHPAVDTMLPVNAREAFTNGTLPIFDAVATFSSVEHSGWPASLPLETMIGSRMLCAIA